MWTRKTWKQKDTYHLDIWYWTSYFGISLFQQSESKVGPVRRVIYLNIEVNLTIYQLGEGDFTGYMCTEFLSLDKGNFNV